MSNNSEKPGDRLSSTEFPDYERKVLELYGVDSVFKLPDSVQRDLENTYFRILDEENRRTWNAIEGVWEYE